MSFDAIGAFVMTEPFGLNTGIARIFTACESMSSNLVHLGFFDLLPPSGMQGCHDLL
jgi:hypothetical protein